MLITPDHLTEKTRDIIRSASGESFTRQRRRAERLRRLTLIALALAVTYVVFALATRSGGWWVVFLPSLVLIAYRRQVERDEHAADVMKIALNPEVISELRRVGGHET